MDGDTTPISSHPVGDILATDAATVIVEWKIADYKSLFQKRKFGTIARSPTFKMRGATWTLEISHLLSTLGQKLVTVYIHRHQSEVRYHSLSHLVAIQINEREVCGGFRKTFRFGKSNESCSIAVTEKELLERMASDALTVLLTVLPEGEERTPDATMHSVTSETNSIPTDEGVDILASNLKDLFINADGCDFVMRVKSREFHVHKAVLSARSPVLSAMLHHDMAEKHSNATEIVDCEPEVFQQFLLYLYGGRAEELSWDNVISLYFLGDKYDLKHLRKVCLEFMEDNLCLDVFCDVLSLAVSHSELMLLEKAEDFFVVNVKSILVTNKWQLLMQENPVVCNELFLKCYE